jgi:hypothetical protein
MPTASEKPIWQLPVHAHPLAKRAALLKPEATRALPRTAFGVANSVQKLTHVLVTRGDRAQNRRTRCPEWGLQDGASDVTHPPMKKTLAWRCQFAPKQPCHIRGPHRVFLKARQAPEFTAASLYDNEVHRLPAFRTDGWWSVFCHGCSRWFGREYNTLSHR